MKTANPTLTIFSALLIIIIIAGCNVPEMDRFDPISGTLEGMDVSAPVKVVRDKNGIVHIRAENDEDLFFAVGYSMAQDRFMIMDLFRRAGGGRLSELLGSPGKYKDLDLPHMDIALRAFLFNEAAKKGAAELDPQSRKLLSAFTRGVNRYLADGGDTLAIYRAWDTPPAPWTIEDSFLVSGIMGLSMTVSSFFVEYYLERIRREYGEDVRDFFVPHYPDDAAIITRDEPLLSMAPKSFLPHPFGLPGSNNWAVSGTRTVSGLPLLANDPHVPSTLIPTFWWHCHLTGGSYDVMGMMFSGLPCFGAATNGKVAWTLTNVMADYIDIWRERINPDNPDQYLADDKWVSFKKVDGEVAVRGKRKPVKYTMRLSRHGAVIDKKLLGWKVASGPGEVLVMKYMDMDLARWFLGYQKMAVSTNFDEWLAGARDESRGAFAWNHTYADAAGNIAYWATGQFPVRADNQGYIARKGWESDQDWQGVVPFEDNPHLVNPKKGYLVSANNRAEVPGYPHYITVDYVSPSRATIISERIEEKAKLDVDDMKRIQYDVTVWSARTMVPIILKDLEGADAPVLAEAANILRDWRETGYNSDVDSRGTCVYEVFLAYLPGAVFKDDLSKAINRGASNSGLLGAGLDKIIDDPDSPWFDDKKTRKIEGRRDIIQKVMRRSMKYLKKKLGKNSNKWRWGDISKITFSTSFVPIPMFTAKGSLGPYPLPGTGETVNAADQFFLGRFGFRGFVGPTSRLIVDFRDPRKAYFNCTTGMSDNEKGGRYDNLTPYWLNGEYLIMSMDEDDYRDGMMGELVLNP